MHIAETELFLESLRMFCPNCGLSEKIFLETGRFGCKDCHRVFFSGVSWNAVSPDSKSWKAIESIAKRKDLSPKERKPSFRFRLSRCFARGFFPYFDRQSSRVQEMAKEANQTIKFGRFCPSAEDHFRWEWVGDATELRHFNLPKPALDFFSDRNLWAFTPSVGFLNSCPTNCGRGDRFSVQWTVSSEERWMLLDFGINWKDVALGNSETQGHRIQISWKNLRPRQKLQIQKILSLLDL